MGHHGGVASSDAIQAAQAPAAEAPTAPSDASPESPEQTAEAQEAAPRRGMLSKSARDMILSLIAVLAFGAIMYMFIPHSGKSAVHQITYQDSFLSAQRAAPYPILEPVGLPSGYRATSVEYDGADADDAVWHLGFVDPDNQYVALEQSNAADQGSWLADVTNNATRTSGTVEINGQSWARYQSQSYRALVWKAPKDTVVVTGTESWAQLAKFATALHG